MRWEDRGQSADVEDRRGRPGFGGGGLRLGLGGFLVLAVLSIVFKQNFFALLDTGGGGGGVPTASAPASPEEEKLVHFVSFVLDDVQGTWEREFQALGRSYERSRLARRRRSRAPGAPKRRMRSPAARRVGSSGVVPSTNAPSSRTAASARSHAAVKPRLPGA